MLILSSDIQIGPYKFKGVNEVQVNSSWDNLTDTCTIVFPRAVEWRGRPIAGPDGLLKRGMAVTVRIGYDGNNVEVFRGYVRDVAAQIPVKVSCEDGMYLLKRGEFTGSYKKATLPVLVSDMLEAVGLDTPVKFTADFDLGQFRISKATPAKVLQYLREHYFVRAWFRAGTLNVGIAYDAEQQRRRRIRFDRNVISHTLEFREKDDVRLNLKAIITNPENKREEVVVGDEDGEQRTFHYYNISTSAAKALLEKEAERLRFTGWRGSFVTFGKPDIRHGDIVELVDPIYPERDGSYLVKRVQISFGEGGYRQDVELEEKAV